MVCSDSSSCSKCNETSGYSLYGSSGAYTCVECSTSDGQYTYTGSDTYKYCESIYFLSF